MHTRRLLGMGHVRLRLEGLSLEKLISRATSEGIRFSQVQRQDIRTLNVTVRSSDLHRLKALADKVGWRVTILHESMLRRSQTLISRRVMLAAGLAVFVCVVWAAMQCVWFVRIDNAAESVGEVRRVLAAHDIVPGRIKARLDLPDIQRELERRLPRIAWVDVHYEGVSLVVSCVPARIAAPMQYGVQPCDVIATRDGVIASVTVFAGTAKVKVGSTVKRGQVLVAGEEHTADGQMRRVPARAAVDAKAWYIGRASIPAQEVIGESTGMTAERTVLATPWFSWPQDESSPFAEQDIDLHRKEIGGMFVPLWLKTEIYEEVTLHQQPRDRAELEKESAAAAERIAQEKVPFHVEIVDKWVEYSMMKDELFCAEVVLEAIENIGELSPVGELTASVAQERTLREETPFGIHQPVSIDRPARDIPRAFRQRR